jgi:hypothetical protein
VVDTFEDPCATLPTATQAPDGGQDRADTAANFGGGAALLHVVPPSELETNTGVEFPVAVAPAPMHNFADWHETSKIDEEPSGSVTS